VFCLNNFEIVYCSLQYSTGFEHSISLDLDCALLYSFFSKTMFTALNFIAAVLKFQLVEIYFNLLKVYCWLKIV